MTEKELLYFEDAIKHEDNVIKIIDLSLEKINDKKLISFMEKEKNNHQKIYDELLKLLEDKVNE